MASPSPTATFKKPQPLPWTHEETVHLIQAYQEKWYALKRGQLKSSQWEEVAVTVAARCGYDHTEPSSKSALQCRHKMEKLRQRYRSEKQRGSPPSSSWPYFHLMDSLDRGPLPPISARPISLVLPPRDESDYDNNNDYKEEDGFNDDDDEEDYDCHSRSRSISYILQRPTIVNRFAGTGGDSNAGGKSGGGVSRFLRDPAAKRRREGVMYDDDDDGQQEEEEEEEGGEKGGELVLELAAEIRAFAERLVGMENMKIKMMKDTEKFRMEMENKRMALILDSQQRIVDSIESAFGSP